MMSITARQASSRSPATMTPFPAASPLAFTTSAGKSALETPDPPQQRHKLSVKRQIGQPPFPKQGNDFPTV